MLDNGLDSGYLSSLSHIENRSILHPFPDFQQILRKRAENNESFCIENFGFPDDEKWNHGSQQVPNTRDSMSLSLRNMKSHL